MSSGLKHSLQVQQYLSLASRLRFFPLRSRCFIRKWVNPTFPDPVGYSAHIVCLSGQTKLSVDRRRSPGLGVFSGEGGSKRITTYPVQVPVLRYSSAAKRCLCRFLAILDVRTIYRYQAKHDSPVKWCCIEKVELLEEVLSYSGHASMPRLSSAPWCFKEVHLPCKLAMPRLSSGV